MFEKKCQFLKKMPSFGNHAKFWKKFQYWKIANF